jgi:hypothetical protein
MRTVTVSDVSDVATRGCARGCCRTEAEHFRSLAVRVGEPRRKVTVDHTDSTVNTVTEHWHDRQDVAVQVLKPVTMRVEG